MTNQWDYYADLYNKGIGLEGDKLHIRLINPVIEEFIGNVKNKTILDAGCGNGYLVKKLAKHAKKIVGIDSSRKLLDYAVKNVGEIKNTELIFSDLLQKLPFIDESFDVIIANMILQYLPKIDNFISETVRILKNKGILIIIIDHPAHSLFYRAQELIGRKNEKFLSSNNYFTEEERKKKSLWDKAVLNYYHRPLKFYLNSFTRKFKLQFVEEKTENDEIPRIAAFKWTKL